MNPFNYLQKNFFTKPYRLLPVAVLAFFSLCFLLHPLSPIHTGQLSDPDDYMRLNEVVNWLNGQGWYDISQPRLSPGSHTLVHWSRLVDLPIAFLTLAFTHSFGLQDAALIAAFIIPLILFDILLVLIAALTKPFVGKDHANLSTLFLLFAPMVLFNFSPGRVDHHAYQILIAGFGLFCLERLLSNAKAWPYALLSALAFACGLWIGTEALPWIVIFILCFAVLAAWQGGFALRHAAFFGVAFFAATLLVLPLALPSNEYSILALSWFSSAYVIFAGLTAFVFTIGGILGQQSEKRALRLSLMAALGLYSALTFVSLVPDALQGPFANYTNFNSSISLENINEARPLWHALWIDPNNSLTITRAFSTFIHLLAIPLTALVASGYALLKTRGKTRFLWIISGSYLLVAFLLTLFWQLRVGYFMQVFALAPLTWLFCVWRERIAKNLKSRPRLWAEIGIFILLGPLTVIFFPTLFEKTLFYPDMVLFPAARAENTCPLKETSVFLTQKYNQQKITIMTGMNEGPELLFRTNYQVIGGNYNVMGNDDVFAFFNARDDQTAQNILKKWHASLVLTCHNVAPFLAGFNHPEFGKSMFLIPGKDGKLHITSSPNNPTLLEKLVNEKTPSWLKPVEIPGNKDYLLFEVKTGINIK